MRIPREQNSLAELQEPFLLLSPSHPRFVVGAHMLTAFLLLSADVAATISCRKMQVSLLRRQLERHLRAKQAKRSTMSLVPPSGSLEKKPSSLLPP